MGDVSDIMGGEAFKYSTEVPRPGLPAPLVLMSEKTRRKTRAKLDAALKSMEAADALALRSRKGWMGGCKEELDAEEEARHALEMERRARDKMREAEREQDRLHMIAQRDLNMQRARHAAVASMARASRRPVVPVEGLRGGDDAGGNRRLAASTSAASLSSTSTRGLIAVPNVLPLDERPVPPGIGSASPSGTPAGAGYRTTLVGPVQI